MTVNSINRRKIIVTPDMIDKERLKADMKRIILKHKDLFDRLSSK